jgi:hypothetical protein
MAIDSIQPEAHCVFALACVHCHPSGRFLSTIYHFFATTISTDPCSQLQRPRAEQPSQWVRMHSYLDRCNAGFPPARSRCCTTYARSCEVCSQVQPAFYPTTGQMTKMFYLRVTRNRRGKPRFVTLSSSARRNEFLSL